MLADDASPGLPSAPLREVPPELRVWLGRLKETVADLSRRVADQEARLDALTGLLESRAERPVAPLAHRLAASPVVTTAPRWRRLARRVAGGLLRAPGALLERLAGAAKSRWIQAVADGSRPAPRLRPGEEVVVIEVAGRAAELPLGFLELATWVMAAEDLLFLELCGHPTSGGADFELWLCRREWPWRQPADLATLPARLPGQNPVLGRRLLLDGDPHPELPPAGLASLEFRADAWLRPGAPAGLQLVARTGRPPGAAPPPPTAGSGSAAILLTRPLDSGLEELVAALVRQLRADGRQVVLAATCDLRASHRSLAEVAPREVTLYPLATFCAPELRGAMLALLLAEAAVGTIVQVGPGEGVFDQPELQELLQRCPGIDLPLPLLPGSPVTLGRPAGAPLRSLTLDPATPGLLLSPPNLAGGLAAFAPAMGDLAAARLAARQRLGLPEDGFLACQMADLVAGERPEDLVELAWRCPEIRFLQVGRGGLAGRRDDLRRFRGATNLRCLPAAELADVLAAADVMLALGEPSLWPWPIFGALAAGVPVVGRPLGALAPYANYLLVASSLAEMVERLAAQRRDGDPPGRRPRPPAAAGAATLAELLGS